MNNNSEDKLVVILDINYQDEETGVDAISFVKNPATKVDWFAFGEEGANFDFNTNADERMVTGPIMLPNTLIKRVSPVIGTYYVKFTEDTIKEMMKKYFKFNKGHNVSEAHNKQERVQDVFLVESFIIGDKVSSNVFPGLPSGTWMGTFHVEDESYWEEKILSGAVKGFSLEGFFDVALEESAVDEVFSKVEEVLMSDISDEDKYDKIAKLVTV